MRIRIKICCISSIEEARLAIEFGADAIGLVGKMPSGPGPIPDGRIRQIAKAVPPAVSTFLLTSETSSSGIIKHCQRTHTSTVQIVDLLSEGSYSQIKEAFPAIKIVQVIHVIDTSTVELAIRLSGLVDALLLDSGNPNLKIKELGGTGRIHNWKLSRQIRDNVRCPVFLAGGLNSDNVRQAIDEVQPFGVDVCSGVRTMGVMDGNKLGAFVRNARSN